MRHGPQKRRLKHQEADGLSRRTYSKHIPDFRLVTHYGESGTSIVHRANHWTKAALLGAVVALATILTDLIMLLVLLSLAIAFYKLARLPIGVLIGWYTLPALFVVTLAIMFVFTEPGEEYLGMDLVGTHIVITDNGLLLLAKLLLRALSVVTFSLAVFMSTKYEQVAHMAHRSMPRVLATMFLLTYRFLFVTSDEVADVLDAMHSRSGSLVKGATRQTKMFAGIFGLSFIHAFERAERISKAMESRGFTGQLPSAGDLPGPTWAGYALVTLGMICVILSAYSRYVEKIGQIW